MRVYRIVIRHGITREVATPEKYGPLFDKEIFTDLDEALEQQAAFCDGGYDAVIQPSYEDGSFQDVYSFFREAHNDNDEALLLAMLDLDEWDQNTWLDWAEQYEDRFDCVDDHEDLYTGNISRY